MRETCAVLEWAASGAMALTGWPDGPPADSPAPAYGMLRRLTAELARATGVAGTEVRADPAELLTVRAALAGLTRAGRVSAGGASFLLRSSPGWCAVTLSRPEDLLAVPAIIGTLGLADLPLDAPDSLEAGRRALRAAALAVPATDLADAAQLVGVPAAALPHGRPAALDTAVAPPRTAAEGWPPWRTERISAPVAGGRLDGAVVADLSAMWAGPLCARLLGQAGAQVVKVESPRRPDGARAGNREFYDWLHAGHQSLAVDFNSRDGHAALRSLLEVADVVIEASRPRALAAVGLAAGMIAHPPGQVWLSITGFGQAAPDRVAFGDDAAVAGGLVGWVPAQSSPEPVFSADAIADPLTGISGALAVALSRARGGGERIDLSMRAVAAAFAGAPELGHGRHHILPSGEVTCPQSHRVQAVRPPRPPSRLAGSAHAPELGADNRTVLGSLTGRSRC
jgi:CoA-transferase family III